MSTSKEVADFLTMFMLMQSKKREAANDKINNAYRTMQMKQMQQQIDEKGDAEGLRQKTHDAELAKNSGGGGGGGGAHADVSTDPVSTDLNPTARAFLNGVSGPESAGKYNVRYTPNGGATFNSYDTHPGIFEKGPAGPSSAAGRYQITKTTWDNLPASAKGDGTFSPANQDRAAWFLAQRDYKSNTGRDLTTDLSAGKLNDVAKGLGSTWAGLKDNPQSFVRNYNSSIQRFNNPSQAPAPGATPAPAPTVDAPQAIPTQAQLSTPTPGNPDGNWRGYTPPTLDNLTPAEKAKVDALKVEYKKAGNYSDPLSQIDMDRDAAAKAARAQAPQAQQAQAPQVDQPTPPVGSDTLPPASLQTPSGAPKVDTNTPNPYGLSPQALQAQVDYDWQRTQAQPQPQDQQAQAPQVEQPIPPVGSDQQAATEAPAVIEDPQDLARGGSVQHFANGGSVKAFADGGSTGDSQREKMEDGREDMTSKYNTQLSPADEATFQKWAQDTGHTRDLQDYDMRGAWKQGAEQGSDGHFTDQYKKPNHPTFSTESQYHGVDGYQGGTWGGDDNSPTFAPSAHNIQNLGAQGLQEYFNRVEPNTQLVAPQNSQTGQTAIPTQGNYANGGSVKSFADGGSADDDDDEEEPDAPTAPAAPAQSSPVAPTLPAPTQGIADPSQPPAQSFQANAAPQTAPQTAQPVTSGGNDTPDNNPLSGLFSAVSKGIRSLEGEHGLTNDALPASAQAAQGRQNFLSGKGAASPEQLAAVKKVVDPTGQLNENLANCAALEATSNFWLERGEPEKAAKASGAMMLLLRNTSAKYGDLATQELNAGHTLAGLHAITKAYDQVPDGNSVSATPNPDGYAEVVHRDPNGKIIWQGRATPAQLLGVALGLKNGTEYWKQLIQNAGSKDPEYEKPDTQEEKDTEEGSDAQTRLGIPEPGQAARHISTTMTPEEYAGKSSAFRGGADAAYQTQKGIAADRAAPSIAAAKAAAAVKGETQKQALENEKAADAQFDTALATYAPPGGKPPELTGADKADVVSAAQHIMTTPGIGATEANRMALDVRFDKSALQPDPKNPGGGIFTRPGEPPVALKAPAVLALKRIRATRTARDAEAAIAAKARQGNIDRITEGIGEASGKAGQALSNVVGAVRQGIPERAARDPLSYDPTF